MDYHCIHCNVLIAHTDAIAGVQVCARIFFNSFFEPPLSSIFFLCAQDNHFQLRYFSNRNNVPTVLQASDHSYLLICGGHCKKSIGYVHFHEQFSPQNEYYVLKSATRMHSRDEAVDFSGQPIMLQHTEDHVSEQLQEALSSVVLVGKMFVRRTPTSRREAVDVAFLPDEQQLKIAAVMGDETMVHMADYHRDMRRPSPSMDAIMPLQTVLWKWSEMCTSVNLQNRFKFLRGVDVASFMERGPPAR